MFSYTRTSERAGENYIQADEDLQGKAEARRGIVLGINSDYVFELTRPGPTASWLVTEVRRRGEPVSLGHQSVDEVCRGVREAGDTASCPTFTGPSWAGDELFALDRFKLLSAHETPETIGLDFEYSVGLILGKARITKTHVDFDRAKFCLPVRVTQSYDDPDAGVDYECKRTITEADAKAWTITTASTSVLKSPGRSKITKRTADETVVQFRALAGGAFTLSEYGLPEPPFVRKPVRGTPVYVWLLLTGFAFSTAYVFLRRYAWGRPRS